MKVYIFLNSANPGKETYREHLRRTKEHGDYVIGDLDSVKDKMIEEGFKVERYPEEKDFSDFELGLRKAQEMNAEKVFVYGALGGRKDHEIVNIVVMANSRVRVVFVERETEIYNVINELRLSVKKGCVCSLVSVSGPCLVSEMRGFKYLLKNELLEPGSRGLSNIACDDEISVKIKEGNLIAIVNRY
jgi:thiamine pyrophosphokinase